MKAPPIANENPPAHNNKMMSKSSSSNAFS